MPGGNQTRAQLVRAPQKRRKLDLRIAADARIWRSPSQIRAQKRLAYMPVQLLVNVRHLKLHAQPLRARQRIRPRVRPGNVQIYAVDLISPIHQHARRNRRIHAVRQTQHHFFQNLLLHRQAFSPPI